MSTDSVIANKSLIKGFLTPIFFEEHGNLSALGPADFGKVRDGYACARCLCEYTTFLVTCPVCGWKRDLAQDLAGTPDLWVDHLKEREATSGMDTGAPRGFDEFMADVNANPDVDQIPLSKLKPRKRH